MNLFSCLIKLEQAKFFACYNFQEIRKKSMDHL